MAKIYPYESPDLPSFEEVQAGGRYPAQAGDRELVDRSAGDIVLYAHETAIVEADAAREQGAITNGDHTAYIMDALKRVIVRRRSLRLSPRP